MATKVKSKYDVKPTFTDIYGNAYYQARYQGEHLSGYYIVLTTTGDCLVYSDKRGNKILKPMVSGKSKYPKVNFGGRTIQVHQVVAQTFYKYPLPGRVTQKVWDETDETLKECFDHRWWQANHIDHDPLNYHPLNLEWVDGKDNVNKYHIHRLSQ